MAGTKPGHDGSRCFRHNMKFRTAHRAGLLAIGSGEAAGQHRPDIAVHPPIEGCDSSMDLMVIGTSHGGARTGAWDRAGNLLGHFRAVQAATIFVIFITQSRILVENLRVIFRRFGGN